MLKDSFDRNGRWDSVGLDCSNCLFLKAPAKWPDVKKEVFCNFHKLPLTVELGNDNYKQGEWFCKSFKDNGKSLKSAVKHFDEMKNLLSDGVLYRFEKKGEDFKEINLSQLSV